MDSLEGILDEIARAGDEHLDPGYVAEYDRKAAFAADAVEEVQLLCGLGLEQGRRSSISAPEPGPFLLRRPRGADESSRSTSRRRC